VRGKRVCRHHGAYAGAPKGNRNALRHGRYTAAATKEMRALRRLLREGKKLVAIA
jgi:glucans biosynthesis protein